MGKVSSVKSSFEKTIQENERQNQDSANANKKKSSSSTRHKKKKSVEKKAQQRVKDAETRPRTLESSDKQGENSTLVTEESSTSSCTFDDNSANHVFHATFEEEPNNDDFDFDDDDWDPQVAKSGRKNRAPVRKKLSQRKLFPDQEQNAFEVSFSAHDKDNAFKNTFNEKDKGFEVSFNGHENETASGRTQQTTTRKQGRRLSTSRISTDSSGVTALFEAEESRSKSRSDRDDDMMSVSSFSSRTSTASRRSSMGRSRRASLGRASLGRASRSTGSAGLQYGTPECEAYIGSLPPAFQISERRRLQQKHLREQERLKLANSAEVIGKIHENL